VCHHHIPLNKERKNVGDMVGFIERRIALIQFKPPPPTLANQVPIIKFMGMM
jgi:hypothetical protein